MKKILLVVLFMILTSALCSGAEYPYIYKGMRPMGMGGAFVAVSNDANALFYNPAGLADIKTIRASIFPLEMEVGENAYDIYRDAADVDFDDEIETAEFLRENIGERAHLALNLFPSYSMPGFAFGLIGTARMDLEVYDRQYPKVITNVINDTGVGAGYAHGFLDDTLLVGASAKYINRQSLTEEYTVLDITSEDFDDLIDDNLVDGNGVLVDVGVICKLDDMGMPGAKIGISANNLVGGDLGDAQDVDDHVDVGFAVDHEFWITKTTLALDYVDVFSQLGDDDDIAKRIRLGAEIKFPKVLSLRVGLYQGYFTSGLTLDAKYARLDILTYAEEIGAYAGQRTDRRYSLRFILGF